jgi:hypothetical protein
VRDAKKWVTNNQQAGISSDRLEDLLVAFPTFTSHHLDVKANGHISNRALVALYDESVKNVVTRDPDMATISRSISQFHSLLLAARWMCEDPEKRLYTKCFDPPVMEYTKDGGRGRDDDTVSVQTDSQSQTGMWLTCFFRTSADDSLDSEAFLTQDNYSCFISKPLVNGR